MVHDTSGRPKPGRARAAISAKGRAAPPPYASLNRAKILCLDCRACFKRDRSKTGYTCPTCGGAAVDIGSAFKAPRRTATRQWEVVLFLANHGFRYRKNAGPAPRTMSEARRRVGVT